MSLLQYKKKRSLITGNFSYGLKNAIVFSRARNKWFLRFPKEILRVMKLHVGNKIEVSSEGGLLIIGKKNIRKRSSARRKIRIRFKSLKQVKR